jgi:hypothetical protein
VACCNPVAVQLDTSKALLRPSQLEALVAAVLVAHDHDEDDWLEWKGTLDLTLKDAKEHIAKQVLGFSNRTVATAARHAEGYAYLLVGVEPGSLVGVDTIDNADLVSGINRYVGDGPRWPPERVSSGDKTVLVIIVDPPKSGDPIFTLQRGFKNHAAGAIFVRQPGKTEQATPGQVTALVERAKADRDTLDVGVRATPATIEAGPVVVEDQLMEIIDAERELLMRPVRSRRPAPKPSRGDGLSRGLLRLLRSRFRGSACRLRRSRTP